MYIDITKITIIVCWIVLGLFWCLKLFGGNFFELIVGNDNFIKFSNLAQSGILRYVLSLITISISNYLFIGAITQQFSFKGKNLYVVIFCIVSMWFITNFVEVPIIKMFYGYAIFVIIGIVSQQGYKRLFGLLAIVSELTFTILSLLIRNMSIDVQSNYMMTVILSIDVYIMVALYYLYSNLIKLRKDA